MARRSATPSAPLASGVIAGEVAAHLAADGDAPPAWIKLTPAGRVATRDGRSYAFDPAALAARFRTEGIDIPVDLDHGVSKRAMFGEAGAVVGWIKEVEARADGTWGRVEWLPAGLETLAARTHRYVSPTFHHADDGTATWLHSISLVPAPALAMPAVASATPTPSETSMLKAIAAALGLADTADEAACLAAISTMSAGKVDKALYDQAVANLAAANAQVIEAERSFTALNATIRKGKVDALLDEALKAKKILPAQRPQFAALCATDEGLAQVEALLASTPAHLQASGLDSQAPATGDAPTDPAALSAAAAAYQKKLAEGGVTISHADAVIAVKEGKK